MLLQSAGEQIDSQSARRTQTRQPSAEPRLSNPPSQLSSSARADIVRQILELQEEDQRREEAERRLRCEDAAKRSGGELVIAAEGEAADEGEIFARQQAGEDKLKIVAREEVKPPEDGARPHSVEGPRKRNKVPGVENDVHVPVEDERRRKIRGDEEQKNLLEIERSPTNTLSVAHICLGFLSSLGERIKRWFWSDLSSLGERSKRWFWSK